MSDETLLADMFDLLQQAKYERSHFYTAKVLERALIEMGRLIKENARLRANSREASHG